MKKYELIKGSKTRFLEREIYRIRALKDFNNVKAGDIGGWVCSENNLSQEGDCWIYNEAKCLDEARMFNNARMYDTSSMFDNARMYHYARMYDNTMMYDNARMYDNAVMCDNSIMFGNSMMFDNTIMFNNSLMFDNSKMYGNARMRDNAKMYDKVILDKDKLLYGSINKSYKKIFQHHCKNKLITAILTEENEILYSVGCQIGITKERLINIIYNDYEAIGEDLEEYSYRQEYLDVIDMAENYLRKFI